MDQHSAGCCLPTGQGHRCRSGAGHRASRTPAAGRQTLVLFEGARRLSDIALLHACPAGEYKLLSSAKRQRREEVPCDILVCGPAGVTGVRCKQGALPCQVLAEAGLPPGAQLRFAGTQAEVPGANRLHGHHILDARPLQHLPCDPDEVTDVGIAGFLRALTGVLPQEHAVLTPCTASLVQCLYDAGCLGGMSGIRLPQARHVHIIAEDSHHWFLLSIDVREGLATHWDPLPERARAAAESLCATFGVLFGQPNLEFRQRSPEGLGQHCCGAIALCHLMCLTGLLPVGSIGLVNWVQDKARALSTGRALHKGAGGLKLEDKQSLSDLLVTKGVPEDRVQARISEALQKVGVSKIEEGLKAQRQWAVLKAVASSVAPPFRWIKADELEQQIRKRADNKFGTAAGEARAKKRAQAKGTRPKETPQLDPKQLALVEGAFVAEDGAGIPNLSLEDVASNAHGVALCTPGQAQPFLQEARSISVEPLPVVSTAPLAQVGSTDRPTQALRFPAIYCPTSEL